MNEQQPQFDTKTRICCVLAYFSILFFLPLVVAPGDQRAKFHANQGLVLFLVGIVIGIIGVIPVVGAIVALVGGLATFVFAILGIINALKGEMKPLPLIGGIEIIK